MMDVSIRRNGSSNLLVEQEKGVPVHAGNVECEGYVFRICSHSDCVSIHQRLFMLVADVGLGHEFY
jgi:hypothetical protein